MMNTYKGNVLRINLTTRSVTQEPLNMKWAKEYIGGRGLGTKMLMEEIDPQVDPLSEDNKIIIINGPLSGAKVSTGCRYMVVTKSPLNNMIASSNSGGIWGARLKYAGYDAIIVEGKASNPVYIDIDESGVKIVDADELWGLETSDVVEKLKIEGKSSVLNIGTAGENLSLMAAVMNDTDRAAARSGVGAVLGSKHLKAIRVSVSEEKCIIGDNPAFKERSVEAAKTIKANPVSGEGLPSYGTAVLVNIVNSVGGLPTNNWQTSHFENAESISGEEMSEKHLVKKHFCHNCTIGCGRVVKMDDKVVGGPEYETIWGFGSDAGIDNFESIIKANYYCNEVGLDTISASATIAAAMELYEKGFITDEDCDGVALKFGNNEAIIEWIKRMGNPTTDLARLMAQGSYRLCEHYGVPELSMTAKKLEMPAYDARAIQGIGLNYATSNRGGCHVRGYTIAVELLGDVDRTTIEGKAKLVMAFQDLTAVIDSLGLCLFTSFALGAQDYAEIFSSATGLEITADDIMTTGERIYNLERLFNQRAGMVSEDDNLPPRLLNEPVNNEANDNTVSRLDIMLPQYYEARGWVDGFPTQDTLKRLGII